jgi:hypothetical protein
VRGPARDLDFHPRESLVTNGNREVGRLGDDRRISTPALHHCLGANARVLLVDDGRYHQSAGAEPLLRQNPRRIDHRCDTALHVLGAAAVETAITFDRCKRVGHSCDADCVGMPAKHHRGPWLPSLEDADDIRPAGRNLVDTHVEPDAAHRRRNGVRDLALTGSAGHERRIDGVDSDEVAQEAEGRVHSMVLGA